MSRSRKHSPAGGNLVASSDREWKTAGHRRIRRTSRVLVKLGCDPGPWRHLYSEYNSPKDGHRWYGQYEGWDRK